MLVYWLVWFVVFGGVGMLIGQRRGRTLAGLVWAMLLGPIGWLIVMFGPDLSKPKAAACPHCDGVLPVLQRTCNHCRNRVTWMNGRPVKASRQAP